MNEKTKELIAVGASVSANCHPCLEYHVRAARENGASDEEITEAIGMGKMVAKGAMGKMNQFARTILDTVPAAAESQGGCGCK